MPHAELLKRAGVTDLRDNHTVEQLPNGQIIVKAIDPTKKF